MRTPPVRRKRSSPLATESKKKKQDKDNEEQFTDNEDTIYNNVPVIKNQVCKDPANDDIEGASSNINKDNNDNQEHANKQDPGIQSSTSTKPMPTNKSRNNTGLPIYPKK